MSPPVFFGLITWGVLMLGGAPEWAAVGFSIVVLFLVSKQG
jgi:hypothetical protein